MEKLKKIPKGEEITGNIVKHLDKRFLSSLDLIGQGTVTLTIDRVEKLEKIVYGNGNTDENVLLMYFKETNKPLKLCKANIKTIIFITNSSSANAWKGKKIKLAVEKVQAFGKTRPAVRVQL